MLTCWRSPVHVWCTKKARFLVDAILTFAEAQNDPTSLDPNAIVHLTHVESSCVLRVVADRQLPSDTVWRWDTETQNVCRTGSEKVKKESNGRWL